MEVSSPPGTVIGSISQQWSILYPRSVSRPSHPQYLCFRLLIKDELGNPVLRIEGPCWTCSCCGSDVEFNVLSVQTGETVSNFLNKTKYFILRQYDDLNELTHLAYQLTSV